MRKVKVAFLAKSETHARAFAEGYREAVTKHMKVKAEGWLPKLVSACRAIIPECNSSHRRSASPTLDEIIPRIVMSTISSYDPRPLRWLKPLDIAAWLGLVVAIVVCQGPPGARNAKAMIAAGTRETRCR
jgi:hypothetical protein